MMWTFSPWVLLPPIYSLCTAAGLWIVYFLAVWDKKIVPLGSQAWKINESLYPPFISVAGNFPPVSCLFSEVMNLAAFGGFIIAVLRYLQLRPRVNKAWLNVVSLVTFSVACFGMTLVGNVQVFTQMKVHDFGTCLTFGVGSIFCWLQSYITLKVNLMKEGKKVAIVRFLLSGIITVCIVLYFSLASQHLYMQAAQCQWLLVMFLLLFISSLAIDFRHSRFFVTCSENSDHMTSEFLPEESRSELKQL
ncbi:transmembrane protein 150C-like isoform X1 [Betta splendens]|uniref:Transmembrane protein 150C-like isoform X1 n=1 Tax=Betta splendens TaxID=158456 RepID=A0A9W2Y5C7_BETSP|nr:transmembrane protein 150C-like isoform X1 [Betta splendens]XP_055369119.1 transmembrane protein 150C-like isoform X1 [Betta splendens]XP_055369120.1 transmembrane protein 150C-like isoform X1 [Betta splendens]